MQLIKYLMLFLIFISSILIGKYVSKQYVFRLKELEDIKNSLNIFKAKIKFTYEPIPEIFKEISQKTNTSIYKIFVQANKKMKDKTASIAWEEAIDEFTGSLNKEDKQAIKSLSKLLRSNRHRRTIKPDRSNRKLFRATN